MEIPEEDHYSRALAHTCPLYGIDGYVKNERDLQISRCFTIQNPAIYVWGEETPAFRPMMIPVAVSQVSCGSQHVAFLTINGQVYTFGGNDVSQCGLGPDALDYIDEPSIVSSLVQSGVTVTSVVCGPSQTAGIISSQEVYMWGMDSVTQKKADLPQSFRYWGKIGETKKLVQLVFGPDHTAVLVEDELDKSEVWVWGGCAEGQLGLGKEKDLRRQPTLLSLPHDVCQLASSETHMAALTKKGEVYLWGRNEDGVLGVGSEDEVVSTPALLDLDDEIEAVMVSCGLEYTTIIDKNGDIYSWGRNDHGQLGLGHEDLVDTPSLTEIQDDVEACLIKSGGEHNIALTTDRKALLWGAGGEYRMNPASEADSSTPTILAADPVMVEAGSNFTLAMFGTVQEIMEIPAYTPPSKSLGALPDLRGRKKRGEEGEEKEEKEEKEKKDKEEKEGKEREKREKEKKEKEKREKEQKEKEQKEKEKEQKEKEKEKERKEQEEKEKMEQKKKMQEKLQSERQSPSLPKGQKPNKPSPSHPIPSLPLSPSPPPNLLPPPITTTSTPISKPPPPLSSTPMDPSRPNRSFTMVKKPGGRARPMSSMSSQSALTSTPLPSSLARMNPGSQAGAPIPLPLKQPGLPAPLPQSSGLNTTATAPIASPRGEKSPRSKSLIAGVNPRSQTVSGKSPRSQTITGSVALVRGKPVPPSLPSLPDDDKKKKRPKRALQGVERPVAPPSESESSAASKRPKLTRESSLIIAVPRQVMSTDANLPIKIFVKSVNGLPAKVNPFVCLTQENRDALAQSTPHKTQVASQSKQTATWDETFDLAVTPHQSTWFLFLMNMKKDTAIPVAKFYVHIHSLSMGPDEVVQMELSDMTSSKVTLSIEVSAVGWAPSVSNPDVVPMMTPRARAVQEQKKKSSRARPRGRTNRPTSFLGNFLKKKQDNDLEDLMGDLQQKIDTSPATGISNSPSLSSLSSTPIQSRSPCPSPGGPSPGASPCPSPGPSSLLPPPIPRSPPIQAQSLGKITPSRSQTFDIPPSSVSVPSLSVTNSSPAGGSSFGGGGGGGEREKEKKKSKIALAKEKLKPKLDSRPNPEDVAVRRYTKRG